jgi:hypothetical protein
MNTLSSVLSLTILSFLLITTSRLDAGVRYSQRGATVVSGAVRIEFLTPTLVRMEYSSLSKFTDDPTVVVVKRHWKNVHINAVQKNGWLVVSSDDLTVRYLIGSGRFSESNLKVSWNYGGSSGAWA